MLNTSNDQILTEIGELFGRYREANGDLSFFQNKMTKNAIQKTDYDQWLGLYTHNHPKPQQTGKDPFLNGILNVSFGGTNKREFYAWQIKVLDRLQNRNNDIYVVAPPGGGKTTPLMAHYMVDLFMGGRNGNMTSVNPGGIADGPNREIVQKWSDIFHGLLTGKYLNGNIVPKCLFVTPIRVLSFEQAEGFQEYFIDLFIFLKSLILKCPKRNDKESFTAYMARLKAGTSNAEKIVGNVFGSAGEARYNSLNPPNDTDGKKFNSYVKQFTEKMICVKTGGGSGQYNDQPDNAVVSIATYGSAKSFISKISRSVKFIVFDEAHLYMPSEYGPESDRSQENEVRAAADAYTIIDSMAKQKDAQIAFLSGTIHPDSAQNFCQYLNRYYGRNLAVVSTEKGDVESGNKTQLHVVADDAIREEREQINRVVKWVQNNEKGKAIILFSKRKINKLVDEAVKRISQKDIRQDFNVNQSDRYRKEKIDRFRRALAYSNPNATADQIKDQIDVFIKKEFPTQQEDRIKEIKNKPGAMMIKNKKLRTAVSYGIGYIYRQDDVEPNDPQAIVGEVIEPIAEQDKLIVADLFSRGKINVLIATAAIGVGVNVNIRDMYLPSCMKFEKNKNNEGKFDLNNKREMSQLVNRTGRGKTPISGIYTPSEFVPYMREVVMSGAEDFNKVPAISIGPKDNLKDILIGLSTAASGSKAAARMIANSPRTGGDIAHKIAWKLGKLAEMAKQNFRDNINDIKNVDWLWRRKRHEAELKRQVADSERVAKYTNAQDKIDEFARKLNDYETLIKNRENAIAQLEHELLTGMDYSGKQLNDSDREANMEAINSLKVLIAQDQLAQSVCAVEEYNALLKEINDVHNSSSNTNFRGYRSSKYNMEELTKRLEAVQKKYNSKLLSKKSISIDELNKEINSHRVELKKLENFYNSVRNNPNVPQISKDRILTNIQTYQRAISDTIQKISRIQYIQPTTPQPGNIIY